MYEYISGTLQSLTPTAAIIEAAGVGYFVNISLQSHRLLEGKTKAKLYIHAYSTQQEPLAIFYGFSTAQEREMFRLLISISGVGANTARIMLSQHSTENLVNMIATGNVAAIQKTKGIGAKTAERVILELKTKVLSIAAITIDENGDEISTTNDMNANLEEAIAALVVLGFNRAVTEKIARKIFNKTPEITPEDLIREALSAL